VSARTNQHGIILQENPDEHKSSAVKTATKQIKGFRSSNGNGSQMMISHTRNETLPVSRALDLPTEPVQSF
jgi:hypothetical protein